MVDRRQIRATGRYIYRKSNRLPGLLYRRVRRGLYRRRYDALNWIRMMQNEFGRTNYPWRLTGRAAQRKLTKLWRSFSRLDRYTQNYILSFIGGGDPRSHGWSWVS